MNEEKLDEIIIIASEPYFDVAGRSLLNGFVNINIRCSLVNSIPKIKTENKAYIIINPQQHSKLLSNISSANNILIGMLSEHLPCLNTGGFKFTRKNRRWLQIFYNKFDFLFHSNADTVKQYQKKYPRLQWLPLHRIEDFKPINDNKPYDVIYYGDSSGIDNRRKLLLDHLMSKFNFYPYKKSLWGKEKSEALSLSRVGLNIHYDHAFYFEVNRFNELITNSVCVLSEHVVNPKPFKPGHDYIDAYYDEIEYKLEELLNNQDLQNTLIKNAQDTLSNYSPEYIAGIIYEKILLERNKLLDKRYKFFKSFKLISGINIVDYSSSL